MPQHLPKTEEETLPLTTDFPAEQFLRSLLDQPIESDTPLEDVKLDNVDDGDVSQVESKTNSVTASTRRPDQVPHIYSLGFGTGKPIPSASGFGFVPKSSTGGGSFSRGQLEAIPGQIADDPAILPKDIEHLQRQEGPKGAASKRLVVLAVGSFLGGFSVVAVILSLVYFRHKRKTRQDEEPHVVEADLEAPKADEEREYYTMYTGDVAGALAQSCVTRESVSSTEASTTSTQLSGFSDEDSGVIFSDGFELPEMAHAAGRRYSHVSAVFQPSCALIEEDPGQEEMLQQRSDQRRERHRVSTDACMPLFKESFSRKFSAVGGNLESPDGDVGVLISRGTLPVPMEVFLCVSDGFHNDQSSCDSATQITPVVGCFAQFWDDENFNKPVLLKIPHRSCFPDSNQLCCGDCIKAGRHRTYGSEDSSGMYEYFCQKSEQAGLASTSQPLKCSCLVPMLRFCDTFETNTASDRTFQPRDIRWRDIPPTGGDPTLWTTTSDLCSTFSFDYGSQPRWTWDNASLYISAMPPFACKGVMPVYDAPSIALAGLASLHDFWLRLSVAVFVKVEASDLGAGTDSGTQVVYSLAFTDDTNHSRQVSYTSGVTH